MPIACDQYGSTSQQQQPIQQQLQTGASNNQQQPSMMQTNQSENINYFSLNFTYSFQ
jgi:hypothetical protein